MSADPNESGDFDDFFQSGESGIYEGGPAKLKPDPQPSAGEVEDWGERPLSPETRARQARLRRLVIAIVVPLGVASTALFATRWLRAPKAEPTPLGVAVGAARTVTLAEPPSAPVVATAEAPKPVVTSEPKPAPSAETAAPTPMQKRARSVALAPKEAPKAAPEVSRRRSAEVLPTAAFPVE